MKKFNLVNPSYEDYDYESEYYEPVINLVNTKSVRNNLTIKSKYADTIELKENYWKQHSWYMKHSNRLWLPINLPKPSCSEMTFTNQDNWLAEVFWYRNPEQEVPEYYWIEFKKGNGKCNYLPKAIKEMLKIFQDTYYKPSTRGVVFDIKPSCFSFKDRFNDFRWELYEDKVKKISEDNTLIWYYNSDSKEFTKSLN